MKEKGLDALIVYGAYHWGGTDTGQVNAVYLSNYTAIPHSYVVLPLEADPTLFISFAYHITNAKDCAAIEDVRVAGFDLITGVGNRLKELKLEKGPSASSDRSRAGGRSPCPTNITSTSRRRSRARRSRRSPTGSKTSV